MPTQRDLRARGLRVVLLVVAVSLGACASRTQVTRAGGVEVITLRTSHNNAHIVRQGESLFMVDAGLARDAVALEAQIRAAGVDPAKISAIVITHGHADHVGGAAHFRDRFGSKIVAGGGDRGLLSSGSHDQLCPTDFLARRRLDTDQHERFEPLQADVWVAPRGEQAATVDLHPLTGVRAHAIALPGHTEGSLIVVVGRFALVGDLFRGAIPGWSATRHFYICDLADNQRDLRALLLRHATAAETFFPGHFGPVDRASVQELADEDVPAP